MYRHISARFLLLFALVISALMVGALPAFAKTTATTDVYGTKTTWPLDSKWKPILSLNDPDDGVTPDVLDLVGDNTYPGAYYYNDGTYFYFRFRVDGDPAAFANTGSTAILFDNTSVDSGTNTPDFAFAWDAKSNNNTTHGLELSKLNVLGTTWATTKIFDVDGLAAAKGCNASAPNWCDFTAPVGGSNDTSDGFLRTIDGVSTTSFGTTTFVDIAAKWTFLEANSNLRKNETWRIALATMNNANDHNFLDTDVAGSIAPTASINSGWSVSLNSSPTAAQLGSFTGAYKNNAVRLHWQTLNELNVYGFNVWRKDLKHNVWTKINTDLLPAKNLGQLTGATYRYSDASVTHKTRYAYKIELRMTTGGSEWTVPLRVRVP